ncbi:ABC transporter permease|uniref:Putative spermidine/putrescine transport system permease protein n=1 Tax=Dendrosporobacter quercicolus TaxID=146817 RepID=A0A1G9SMC2_9FIRM|nr:ABC transporter permease [Dendrosporobacter quercicolus]NSL48670.1 ABC transporter permease [Dendrosporobacter quercicolus DSM 1736]SDM36663.1 putative spermidine/putrescine transport system permease protein [Dendrosporobacter quercicolus]
MLTVAKWFKKLPLLLIFNVLLTVFMLAPILVIILVSFSPTKAYVIPTNNWSLQWFLEIPKYSRFVYGFFVSLGLAFAASAIATILGFMTSYALTRYDFKGKRLFDALFFSPLTMPAVIVGFALLVYVSKLGLYDTFFSFLLAHVLLCVPYVIKTINTSLEGVSKDLELAARSLGASQFTTFTQITAPLVKTGIIGGFIYAFLVSFGEVTIALFLSGTKMSTLPLLMFNYMQDANTPMIAAISTLLIIFAILLMIVINKLANLRDIMS